MHLEVVAVIQTKFRLFRVVVIFLTNFWKKKIRSLSFQTKNRDFVADKKPKMGDFWQRHLGGMSGVLFQTRLS